MSLLYLESQEVLFNHRKVIGQNPAWFTPAFRMVLLEQRNRDIESRPVVLVRKTGFGENSLAHVEVEVLRIVRVGSRIKVEYDVVQTWRGNRNKKGYSGLKNYVGLVVAFRTSLQSCNKRSGFTQNSLTEDSGKTMTI